MDQESQVLISVIIPTKDRESILEETLDALRIALNAIRHEVIIVNDSDRELELSSSSLELHCVNNPGSGVASARNFGAANALGEFLLFIDDDMMVSEHLPEELLKEKSLLKNACMNVSWEYPPNLQLELEKYKFGRFLQYYGFTSLLGWYKNHHWEEQSIFKVDAVTSQVLFMRADFFNEIGGYNEHFPFAGFEDYDLLERIRNNNKEILVNSKLSAFHNERDRATDIKAWLARRERGGRTRRVAVDLGYQELQLNYSWRKAVVYKVVGFARGFLYHALALIPNSKVFDSLSFFVINLLYGASVYQGYSTRKEL